MKAKILKTSLISSNDIIEITEVRFDIKKTVATHNRL